MLLAASNISGSIDDVFILHVLEYIKNVIISVLEVIVGLVVLIFVSGLFIFLSTKSKGAVIFPFEVNINNKTYNGKIISDSLIAELRKIEKIHKHQFEEKGITCEKIYLPKVALNTENLETKISNLGDVNIAGMALSVGGILTVLKQLWPLGEPAKTIKGSLQEYDSEIHLIALMEGPRVYGWNSSRKIEQSANEDKIPELIKDLAFMITYDLSKEKTKKKEGITAKTWISFKYFTEALDSYSQYTATKKPEHLENARINCIKALQEETDYQILANLFYSLGISYYYAADYNFAEDAFRRCIDLMPDNENGFISLGVVLDILGLHTEALEAYNGALEACEKRLKTNPRDAVVLSAKGFSLDKLGRYEKSLEAYKEALEACEKSLKINPDDSVLLSAKGFSLNKLTRYEKALEAFEKTLKTNPEDAVLLSAKSFSLNKLGRYEEALEACEKALEIKPKFVEAWYSRACVYSMMNKKNEALADLKRAVELDLSYKKRVTNDKDFEKLWEDKDFKEIVKTNEES
ncbi:tetratricopeptide repeat protein [Methanosarcina sp.]|uniref:tetratricopeptide repeat protein n=1 Tax=Methanosarcina sp. TaxID=2213 RepID=UPI003C73E776